MLKQINSWWKQKFTKGEEKDFKKANQNMHDAFLKQQTRKKEEEKFFKAIKYRDVNKTPVFLTLITVILTFNILIFFLLLTKSKIGLENLDSDLYPLFFGANHTSSIIEGKQIWRLFTFAFLENISGYFNFFIALIFIWLSFYKIGFLQESFFGSKKSSIIWIGGILILGVAQFVLTRNEAVYYYGTDYISWISIGAMSYLLISNTIKNEQARSLVGITLIKVLLILIIFGIIKFVNIKNSIDQDNQLLRITGFYITFPILAFLLGFGIALSLNYKEIESNVAIYAVSIFFVILVIVICGMMLWSLTSLNLGQATWDKIKDFY